MKIVVGADDEDPIDVGPALAVLRAPRSSRARIAAVMRALRMDLFVRNQGGCGFGSVETIPLLVEILGSVTPRSLTSLVGACKSGSKP